MTDHIMTKTFSRKISLVPCSATPPIRNVCTTKSSQSSSIPTVKIRHNFFKNSIFPAVTTEWNIIEINLRLNIRNSSFINVLEKELLKFIRPEPNLTYNINDTEIKIEIRIEITYKLSCGIPELEHRVKKPSYGL